MKQKIILITKYRISSHIFATYILVMSFLLFGSFQGFGLSVKTYTNESALNSGNWVRVKVTETGIHKITQADISKWGFSDIQKIRIFGYGGSPVTEILDNTYIDDLPQVPVLRNGNQILFYAQSHESWNSYTSYGMSYKQVQHPYSEAGYYFITDKDVPDLLVEKRSGAITGNEVTTFTERFYYEKELYSPGQTGRYLLGEDFKYKTSQSFKFSLPDYVNGTKVYVLTAFGAKVMNGTSQLSFQQNGTNLPYDVRDKIDAVTSPAYEHVKVTETCKSFIPTTKDITYTINYKSNGTLFVSRLDYITINYTRSLKLVEKALLFSTESASNDRHFSIAGASSNTLLWDVTKNNAPIGITLTMNGTVGKFAPIDSKKHDYVAFEPSASYNSPTFVENISNQNFHGVENPNMVIITRQEFNSEAQRIAELHRTQDKMKVLVINQQDIYNEFSSGTPDAMAYRKLMKMFWDRWNDNKELAKPGYLLLFGRGSYDNRQITEKVKESKYPKILTWQSVVGDNENSSYNTDDIFGILSDGSGIALHSNVLDIAIGRMPVKSASEAKIAVDKLYRYVTKKDFGSWKNNMLIVADDEDGAEHMKQSENCISQMKKYGGKQYIYNHIYTDAFTAISVGAGRNYPDARTKMFQKLQEGCLWVNFIGHANPVSWTHDGLLNINDINNMYLNHYPLFLTATCEFTRFDADDVSGGEILFLNGRGGAISLISTSRVVNISDNGNLSHQIASFVFRKDDDGNYPRTGDILKNGKNAVNSGVDGGNRLRYFLIGDPAMRLSYPKYTVNLETINDVAISEENCPTIKARENVTITGSIYNTSNKKATDFNGIIVPTLYDAETSVETNGYGDGGVKYVFQDRSNKLYIGQDSIKNGEFKLNISMPTEIQNNYSTAMFNFYAHDADSIEANGANENLYVYGYDESAKPDTEGPEIKYVVLNSPSFKSGDTVNESPMLTAAFSDKSGINVSTSGIGHQMSLLIDNSENRTDAVQYYTPAIGEGNGGVVNYPLSALSAGNHTLRFKVWDIANNSSEQTIEFNVNPGMKPEIYEVYTTSNPAKVQADFYLKHNRPDALITVTIDVYDLSGKEVWSHTETGKSDFYTSFPITWNLKDNAGRRVNRGIYVYRAGISTDGIQEATKAKKIAVASE
ncbi:MAG: type IX secretion system sortase PorU [Muribaculaceae bacterium]